jgi:Uroporphyrinogen-III synthase HemD
MTGVPTVAPAMREVSLESPESLEFAAGLVAGKFDVVIFLTGAGIRALVGAVEHAYPREHLVDALQRVQVVARGSKPVSALRELGVKPALVAPEPNTWRELLRVLDDAAPSQPPSKVCKLPFKNTVYLPASCWPVCANAARASRLFLSINGLCRKTLPLCRKPRSLSRIGKWTFCFSLRLCRSPIYCKLPRR